MQFYAPHAIARRLIGLALAGATAFGTGPLAAQAMDDGDVLPGQLVSVNGHAMYIQCRGEGSPTVVLDSGLGDSSVVWARVQPRLARLTRVCSYDRAGYGASDLNIAPRTSAVIAEELHDLLDAAGIDPPYVLAGHSFGGWNMQMFAATYPNDVAGLVLVDSSQIYEIERYEDELGIVIAPRPNTLLSISPSPYIPPGLPPAEAARARKLAYDPITMRTIYGEWVGFRTSEHEVAQSPPLPGVPLVVVSRGRAIADPDSYDGRQELLWRQLQQEFVDRHPEAVHLVARSSGHYIQLEQPGLVVHAVCLDLRMVGNNDLDCATADVHPEMDAAAR